MLSKRLILFLLFVFGAWCGFAQSKTGYTQPRILILLDKSSSMIQPWDGGLQKSKVGDELILKLMDSIYRVNNEVEFSLRVFGHQSTVDKNDCHDTRNEVPFRKDNRLQMEYRLEDIKPLGVTSIAYALQEAAANDLLDITHNAYSIILITDGGESCGGDICEVMRRLIQNKVFFKPYIVSLEGTPGLKAAYECMGDYLEVTRKGDVEKAVGIIVQAFTPILKLKTTEYTTVKNIAAVAPKVLNVTIPVINLTDTTKTVVTEPAPVGKRPAAVAITSLAPATALLPVAPPKQIAPAKATVPDFEAEVTEAEPFSTYAIAALKSAPLTPVDIEAPRPKRLQVVSIKAFTPDIKEEIPERPAPEAIGRLAAANLNTIRIPKPNLKAPQPVNYLPFISFKIVEERPEPEVIASLPINRIRTFNIIFVIDENDTKFPYRKPPPMPPLKFDVTSTKTPANVTAKGKAPEGKSAEYTTETEDATETTVEVYFTDGKGKFYATTPQVILLDPATGNMVRRFYRMVDESGHPDPQTNIPPGTYHLTFAETRSTVVNNVKIEANKKNRIIVTVEKASLSFEYANDISRPITEFEATVIERNKPSGKVVRQKCTEKLEFEPGNYHVIITTFPQDVRNLDLDFGEKIIRIPQPGFVKFVPQEGMSSVVLYQRLGDKFLSFHTMSLVDPASNFQHLRIQPGEYQAHYRKGPGGSSASEKVATFIVKAKEETVVQLN